MRKARRSPGYAARALVQRARSTLSYHVGRGRSAPPETVSLLLSYRCNLRCTMCGQWGEGGTALALGARAAGRGLSLDDVRKITGEVGGFSPTITLFGGEPLLYKDIIDVIELIKERGLRVNVITNGTLLFRCAADLVRLGLDEIIFSLDGPPAVHDRVRNKKGVFRAAQRGFAILAEEKKKKKTRLPLVNVNSTIFDFNYLSMEETLETARSLGAEDVTFHHLIFIGRDTYARHQEVMGELFGVGDCDWKGFVVRELPKIDPDALIGGLRRVRERGASIYPNLTDREVREYYTSFSFSPKSYSSSCMSPWMVAYIFPDGAVGPCLSNGVTMGNIRTEPFRAIWNNGRYVRYRREVKRRGHFPACIRCTELYRF